MSFKVTVTKGAFTALSRKIEDITNPIDRATAKKAGNAALDEMLDQISSGRSPIRSKGSFPAYKKSYKDAINSGRYPGKSTTPVNLELSGDFLSSLKVKTSKGRSGFGFSINVTGSKNQAKEEGHRRGANGQRKRPIIPQGSEQFSKPVADAYLDIFTARIRKLINKPLK